MKESDDPLRELGPGINSFHWLMTRLFVIFIFLYLIHIPCMNIYENYNGYGDNPDAGFSVRRSIGNLGFSGTYCIIYSKVDKK